jgi:hypothetical protein
LHSLRCSIQYICQAKVKHIADKEAAEAEAQAKAANAESTRISEEAAHAKLDANCLAEEEEETKRKAKEQAKEEASRQKLQDSYAQIAKEKKMAKESAASRQLRLQPENSIKGPELLQLYCCVARAWNLLNCWMVPANKERRNDLFGISGIQGNYLEFFLLDNDAIGFLGNFETIESMNDVGTLTKESLV